MDQKTKSKIEAYFKEHEGIARTSGFQRNGFHNSYLTELVEEGYLIRLKAGLYLMAEKQSVSGFHEIQISIPSAVICLASALSVYELTTYEPPAVHIAIPRDDRTSPPDYPPVRKFSFGKKRYTLGMTKIEIEGKEIAIYDKEKTICDSIRYRRVLGQDIVNEAVRKYLGSQRTNIDKLIEYSRILKSEGPLQTHLKLMA